MTGSIPPWVPSLNGVPAIAWFDWENRRYWFNGQEITQWAGVFFDTQYPSGGGFPTNPQGLFLQFGIGTRMVAANDLRDIMKTMIQGDGATVVMKHENHNDTSAFGWFNKDVPPYLPLLLVDFNRGLDTSIYWGAIGVQDAGPTAVADDPATPFPPDSFSRSATTFAPNGGGVLMSSFNGGNVFQLATQGVFDDGGYIEVGCYFSPDGAGGVEPVHTLSYFGLFAPQPASILPLISAPGFGTYRQANPPPIPTPLPCIPCCSTCAPCDCGEAKEPQIGANVRIVGVPRIVY